MISREDLAKILVPKYIPAIPETDGWGHPYEFRLNTQDADAIAVMAVRSVRQGRPASPAATMPSAAFPSASRPGHRLDGRLLRPLAGDEREER